MKDELFTILQSDGYKFCVIGTAVDNKPWGAVVGYTVQQERIIISTHTGSKKWANIQKNNTVSLVFGFGFDQPNIQAIGRAELLTAGKSFDEAKDYFYSVNPHAKQFASSDTAFIVVTLTFARLSDFSLKPPRIVEERFV